MYIIFEPHSERMRFLANVLNTYKTPKRILDDVREASYAYKVVKVSYKKTKKEANSNDKAFAPQAKLLEKSFI